MSDNKIEYNYDVGMSLEECYAKHEGTVKFFVLQPKNRSRMDEMGIDPEDAISAGYYGLIKAYVNYQKDKCVEWNTYLGHTIKFHIQNFFNREGNGIIHVPTDVRRLYNKIKYNKDNLDLNGMISLSVKEIMIKLNCNKTMAENILKCEELDKGIKQGLSQNNEEDSKKIKIMKSNPKYKKMHENKMDNNAIYKDIMSKLTKREKIVVSHRMEGYSIREIAPMIGYSRQTVANDMKSIEEKVKEYYLLNGITMSKQGNLDRMYKIE